MGFTVQRTVTLSKSVVRWLIIIGDVSFSAASHCGSNFQNSAFYISNDINISIEPYPTAWLLMCFVVCAFQVAVYGIQTRMLFQTNIHLVGWRFYATFLDDGIWSINILHYYWIILQQFYP